MSQTTTPPPPNPSSSMRHGFGDLGSIRRARHRRMVAGVAEGISRHFDIDPTIVRVLLVVAAFFGGAGLIFYAAAWLTVPEEGQAEAVVSSHGGRDADRVATIGLIAGAAVAALSMLGTIGWAVPHPAPLAVIIGIAVIGLIILLRRHDDPRQSPWWPADPPASTTGTGSQTAATPQAGMPDAPDDAEVDASVSTREAESAAGAEAEQGASDETDGGPEPESPGTTLAVIGDTSATATTPLPPAWWEQPPADPGGPEGPVGADTTSPPPPVPPVPRRPRSHLFGLTLATIVMAMGVLWAVDGLTSYDLDPSVYPGVALGIVAAALIVGTWFGRSRGLVFVGILASLATLVASFVGPGPYGERVYRPAAAVNVHDSYQMGVGHFVLNLQDVRDPHRLEGRTVSADMRIGQLQVVVPSSLDVTINAHVTSGDIRGAGPVAHIGRGGERVSLGPTSAPHLVLNLDLDFGEILVTHVQCPSTGASIGAPHVPACS